jgi:hypothetical protein
MGDDLKKVGRIEVNQDLDFQRAEWRAQRAGWVVLALLALIALFGGFGKGYLANASVRSSRDLTVEYERIARHGAPSRMMLRFDRLSGEVGIAFPNDYFEHGELISITPEPERTESGAGTISYFFQVRPNARIHFLCKPDRLGTRRVRLVATNNAVVQFRQFVLP